MGAAGDVSTDGRWCFMIFKVQLSAGVPAHWALLKKRLEAVCPSAAGEHQLWRWSSLPRDFQHPFLLQVASYDRRGFLHGAPPAPVACLIPTQQCGRHLPAAALLFACRCATSSAPSCCRLRPTSVFGRDKYLRQSAM